MPQALSPRNRRLVLLLGGGLAALLLLGFWIGGRPKGPRYLTATVERGALTAAVEATGTINPLTTVPVGSYVSGTVKLVFADFNTRVRAGQVLAQLDPAVYQAQVVTARGNLAGAEANVRHLEAGLGTSRALIETDEANAAKAQADARYARANAERQGKLFGQGLIPLDLKELSQSTLDQADAGGRAASAQVHQAQAQYQEQVAQVEQARAEVSAMQGSLEQAEANLRYTTILSPTEGTVVAKNVTVGQSVAASLQAPNLFTLAQDLQRMQVYAKTDESDTGFIKMGGDATFQVDAFPNEVFHGRVSVIRLNAYIVQNVVTYDTVIDFENLDERLLPGETAYVTIPTGHAENALLIPNAALTYTPDLPAEELAELYRQAKIPETTRASHTGGQQVVWRLGAGETLEPVAIEVGISDYANTQMLAGRLREGDRLVTGALAAGAAGANAKGAPKPPRAPGATGRPR
jgi:HlyD family secretion protein